MSVGNAHQVHHALDGAVLAGNTVERVEHHVGPGLVQPQRDLAIHVDPRDLVPARLERLGDALAAHQRHRPFAGPAAHEDGDVQLRKTYHRPTRLISHSSVTPWLSDTRRRTSSPSPSMSALV